MMIYTSKIIDLLWEVWLTNQNLKCEAEEYYSIGMTNPVVHYYYALAINQLICGDMTPIVLFLTDK